MAALKPLDGEHEYFQKGFALIDAVLAVFLFGLLMTGLLRSYTFFDQTSRSSNLRARAELLAEEGLEAVRNIRDENFSNFPADGNHGLQISGNQWALGGTSDTIGEFTRVVNIATNDANTKTVNVTLSWTQTPLPAGSLSVVSRFTNWSTDQPVASQTFHVKEYFLDAGAFTGTTYNLTLDQDLLPNYFVIIQGSDGAGTSSGDRGPAHNYAALVTDPFGTGDLNVSPGTSQIGLQRGMAINSWVGVVTVVECVNDCATSGFQLLDVAQVTHSSGSVSGSDTFASSWSAINKVMLVGGFNGSGCLATDSLAGNTNSTESCHIRIYPLGTNTIQWVRNNGGASSLRTVQSTVMAVVWGSEWTVQRVNVTGSAGGNGANSAGEYNTAAITSVARANTWVWGTGHTNSAGVGRASEGTLITLGNGVTQNINETTVATGQELSVTRSFEVYALTHASLSTSYYFKADGNSANFIYDQSVTAVADSSARMAIMYNGSNATSNAYPVPIWSTRFLDNDTIRVQRRRNNLDWPAWIQSIDFSGITE